ncbi:MAG: Histidine phosphatase superfamily (branch 1), partial [Candidatus Solibacter sp.]|nr:Histidine phosphatase superfamily (branch 1) [Candidatus Solibacter sp.]
MARIYIVRHAESSANAGGRSSDETSIPITTTGARQAREL